jgi:hypothetical protein
MKMKGRDIVKRVKNIFRRRSYYLVDWGNEVHYVYPDKAIVESCKEETEIINNFDELVSEILGKKEEKPRIK